MNTVEEYKQNNFPVIPCEENGRKPIGKEWQNNIIPFVIKFDDFEFLNCIL